MSYGETRNGDLFRDCYHSGGVAAGKRGMVDRRPFPRKERIGGGRRGEAVEGGMGGGGSIVEKSKPERCPAIVVVPFKVFTFMSF